MEYALIDSGREAVANPQWVLGGKTGCGVSEAVADLPLVTPFGNIYLNLFGFYHERYRVW